jgi:N4-gp56 family major capsid protein
VLQPCKIDGHETFVCVMHTFQEDDLRANVQTGQWLDIQKAAAAAEGKNNPLFKGSLGMYRGVILHSHRNVIRFGNAGAAGKGLPDLHATFYREPIVAGALFRLHRVPGPFYNAQAAKEAFQAYEEALAREQTQSFQGPLGQMPRAAVGWC